MSKATKDAPEKKQAKKHRALRWLIVTGAVVAVGIILASGGLVTAIQLENRNAFCASCHTEPESEYYQRSLAAPVDLASAHNAKNVACIQCHSAPLAAWMRSPMWRPLIRSPSTQATTASQLPSPSRWATSIA
jgi:hypothetical protein